MNSAAVLSAQTRNLIKPVKLPISRSIIFDGSMIAVGFGKMYVIKPIFSIDCGWLGAPFVTHLLQFVKRSLKCDHAGASLGRGAPARMGS